MGRFNHEGRRTESQGRERQRTAPLAIFRSLFFRKDEAVIKVSIQNIDDDERASVEVIGVVPGTTEPLP